MRTILFELTDEDANQAAHHLGLQRELTLDEMKAIEDYLNEGLDTCWPEVMRTAIKEVVDELKKRYPLRNEERCPHCGRTVPNREFWFLSGSLRYPESGWRCSACWPERRLNSGEIY